MRVPRCGLYATESSKDAPPSEGDLAGAPPSDGGHVSELARPNISTAGRTGPAQSSGLRRQRQHLGGLAHEPEWHGDRAK